MTILSVSNLNKSFGDTIVLENVSFSIEENDRIGLIGLNGTGKSTLLKILVGSMPYDSGNIYIDRNIKIGYLAQDTGLEGYKTVRQALSSVFLKQKEQEDELHRLENLMASPKIYEDEDRLEDLMHQYSMLFEEFKENGGFEIESRIRGVLKGLGFTDEDLEISSLSGGQKTRLALGRILLESPDLLLLDEPTNYLDLESLQWLEGFLKNYPKAFMIVSHDRYFLDNTVKKIFELENNTITLYNGNYSEFVNKKQTLARIHEKQEKIRQKEIQRLEENIQTFISHRNYIQAENRKRRLEELLPKSMSGKSSTPAVRLRFDMQDSSGKEVLRIENLGFSYGDKNILKNVNLKVFRGERIGIIGPNGIGKTTFLKILAGQLEPQEGFVNFGHQVEPVYFEQEQQDFSSKSTVLDEMWNAAPGLSLTEIRTFLAGLLFFQDDIEKTVDVLSGGEKSRLSLGRVILQGANLLLLDEPTNHLDIISKENLEEALKSFKGTIIAVSHDRYFLSKIATRIWEFSDGNIIDFDGSFSYYLEKKNETAKTEVVSENKESKTVIQKIKLRKRQEREKKRQEELAIKELEENILKKEEELEELEHMLCQPEVYSNPENSQKVNKAYNQVIYDLEQLYDELDRLA